MNESLDLFVFADALGWKLASERGFMTDVLPVRRRCETLFGYSSTCDPSILTGCLPREHGHFSCFVYDPERSPFRWANWLSFLPNRVAAHHRLRNPLSRWVKAKLGYTGYFQLYAVPFGRLPYLDYTEKHDIYEPGGIIGGQPTIFEHWQQTGKPWTRSDWRKGDAANVDHLTREIERGDIRLAYLFTAGLDAVMHAHGTEGSEVDRAFDRLESWLRKLLELAACRYRRKRLYLFSDHGMLSTTRASSILKDFAHLGLSYDNVGVVWDSTMARFWFPGGDRARERVVEWLNARDDGTVVSESQLVAWGVPLDGHRYGELFFLLHPGVLAVPSFMNLGWVTGMHGYDPAHESSAACWLATDGDFGAADVGQLTDIHGVMARASDHLLV